MLTHRIIPILLFDGSYCVQTVRFNARRRLGPMEQYVNNMANRNVDELVILDIDATRQNREPSFDKIKKFTEGQFCPVAYGGGIRNWDDIKRLIQGCGVDKVIIKKNYQLIEEAAKIFGSQSIAYTMDCRKHHSDGTYRIDGLWAPVSVCKWVREIQNRGAGELLLTHVMRQGTFSGYSENLIELISDTSKIPIIANGGCGKPEHMIHAINAGANAVAASSMFALRGITPQDCARSLKEAGLPVRL